MTKQLVVNADYNGIAITFTGDGWFNATQAASRFGKRPNDWLNLDETKEYILALCKHLGISESKSLIRTKRGGNTVTSQNGNGQGTWLHPKLAVRFAQWLDMSFAVWCDLQIDGLLRGTHPHHDWQRMRHEAASSFKVMTAIIKMNLEANGKTPCPYHFSNEARLVNWALTGEFCKVDREAIPQEELDLLARLEERNAVLVGREMGYEQRKVVLQVFADDWRMAHTVRIAA